MLPMYLRPLHLKCVVPLLLSQKHRLCLLTVFRAIKLHTTEDFVVSALIEFHRTSINPFYT